MRKNPDFSLDDLDVEITTNNGEPVAYVKGKSDGEYDNKKYTSDQVKLQFTTTAKTKPDTIIILVFSLLTSSSLISLSFNRYSCSCYKSG
ncbi:MAG: hypothetical protein U9532_01295 ['Conium maculatum' witches'-broom phytoplasma]|nr:hypothetical protein ['Conium maculatum' witches'-broom phytoplasma]